MNDSYETKRRRKIEAKVRERWTHWVNLTSQSFTIAHNIVIDTLVDQKVKGYLLEEKIKQVLPNTWANICIESVFELTRHQIAAYDLELQPVDIEDIEPTEPVGSNLDLWSKETIYVIKGPLLVKKASSRKKSSKSAHKSFKESTSRSLVSKSTKKLKRIVASNKDTKIYKQYPLKMDYDSEREKADNKWRKYITK